MFHSPTTGGVTVDDVVLDRALTMLLHSQLRIVATSVVVDGDADAPLVQVTYDRVDPCDPDRPATFVAAHHGDLGTIDYEVVGTGTLLSLEEWRAHRFARHGIYWVLTTPEAPPTTRSVLIWPEIGPVLGLVDSVGDAARLARHLDVPLRIGTVGAPSRAGRHHRDPERPWTPPADHGSTIEADLGAVRGHPDSGVVTGHSPEAHENRMLRRARAHLTRRTSQELRQRLHHADAHRVDLGARYRDLAARASRDQ